MIDVAGGILLAIAVVFVGFVTLRYFRWVGAFACVAGLLVLLGVMF